MSVKELKFEDEYGSMEVSKDDADMICIELWKENYSQFTLDRNQAHLLMLYLQEHLK